MAGDDGGGETLAGVKPVPAWLEEPPEGATPLLVVTAPQVLPFDQVTPENFEKLLVKLVRLDANVEHCQQYGVRGQDQHGIDLYARLHAPRVGGRRYQTVQCRNVAGMTGTDIALAVEDFLQGRWARVSEVFVIATRVSGLRTERADAIEAAAATLRPVGVRFELWDGEELSCRLQALPRLVETFFGPDTARRFCPAASAMAGLDAGATEEKVRSRLELLPPAHRLRVWEAWRDMPEQTWWLITALTSIEHPPTAVVADWGRHMPVPLREAAWQVQLAAGELAGSYRGARPAADLFMLAVGQGGLRRTYWLARAAMLYEENNDPQGAAAAIAAMGEGPHDEPYARAVVAFLCKDTAAAWQALSDWSAEGPVDITMRAALQVRLVQTESGETRSILDRCLKILADALDQAWVPLLAISRASMLIIRARRGESLNLDRDAREARMLAVRARDERRLFRGDSSEAAGVACQAAVLAQDPEGAIALGTVGDTGATPEEAASSVVREFVAVAALQLHNLELARENAGQVTDRAAKARLAAMLADAERRSSHQLWLHALEAAGDNDDDLMAALAGLAELGAPELPGFSDFAVRNPNAAADIQALWEIGRGEHATAIGRLRTRRHSSIQAVFALAHAYRLTGRTDDEVQTLRDAAAYFRDSALRMAAAEALLRAQRYADAEAELNQILTTTPPDWPSRPDALRLAAKLAANDQRPARAAELFEAALQIEPDHSETRWALIRVLAHRGDRVGAWRIVQDAPEGLEPASVEDAKLWVHLHQQHATAEETAAGSLRLLRRFADSEQFHAFVVYTLVTAGQSPDALSENVLDEARRETERFFGRYPDSRYLYQVQATDVDSLLARMNDMVRPTNEEQQWRARLIHGALSNQLPLSLIAASVGRSYAEILVRRPGMAIPARRADPAEISACASAVQNAVDHEIVIDTSAATVLGVLPQSLRDAATSLFTRVITTDDAVRDAMIGDEALATRATGTWIWDASLNRGHLDEIPQAVADQLADQASALLAALLAFHQVPRPTARSFDDHNAPALVAWSSVIDLATYRALPLWSDDPIQRDIARQAGRPATSTPAILDYLLRHRTISPEEDETATRAMIKARIADMPFNEQRLLELAEEDNWAPTSVATVLTRPAIWTDLGRAATLYARLITLVKTHRPGDAATWLYHAVQGATLAHAGMQAGQAAARLLMFTLHAVGAQGPAAATLVQATRVALALTADPDHPMTADPVPICARLLRDAYATATTPALATQYTMAVFADLPRADQEPIIRALLR